MTESREELGGRATDGGSATSETLVQRLQQQDPEAWRRCVRLYYPLVYSWCLRRGLQSADSHDVSQDVFRSLAQSVGRFQSQDGANSFRGWLWGITQNRLKDYWRRYAANPPAAGGSHAQQRLLELAAPGSEHAPADSQAEIGGLCRRALELVRMEFQDHAWQAFWRTVVAGRPVADVAGELGISVNSVYLARSRILRRLRDEIAG